MGFDSTRMRENPGEVFDVVFRDGSTGKAYWAPICAQEERIIRGTHEGRDKGWGASGAAYARGELSSDIVAYAPRTEERWKILHSDGTLGCFDFDNKADAEAQYSDGKAVRVRITVIDEEAA